MTLQLMCRLSSKLYLFKQNKEDIFAWKLTQIVKVPNHFEINVSLIFTIFQNTIKTITICH